MASVREHLTEMHKQAAGYHLQKAKSYRALGKCFAGMAKVSNMAPSDNRQSDVDPENIASICDDLADGEEEACQFSLDCCKGMDKIAEGDLQKAFGMGADPGERLRPDQVSSIIGEMPDNVRPIFRTGQRDFQKLSDTVDANLGKVIGIGDGDI